MCSIDGLKIHMRIPVLSFGLLGWGKWYTVSLFNFPLVSHFIKNHLYPRKFNIDTRKWWALEHVLQLQTWRHFGYCISSSNFRGMLFSKRPDVFLKSNLMKPRLTCHSLSKDLYKESNFQIGVDDFPAQCHTKSHHLTNARLIPSLFWLIYRTTSNVTNFHIRAMSDHFCGEKIPNPYPSSHNHGSGKWIPPIVVTFQIQPFSTSTIMGERV